METGRGRRPGKGPDRTIQGLGERADERAAAGRAGFIHLDAGDRPVVREYGFHVLSSDIQDERDLLFHVSGRHIMDHGFHDSRVQGESCLDQVFAVSGGAGAGNLQGRPVLPALYCQFP